MKICSMRLLLVLLIGWPLVAAPAGEELPLNGVWQFQLARSAADVKALERFYEKDFETRGFRPIPVPSNWIMHGYETPGYGRLKDAGEGFYLHRFTVPESLRGKRTLLHFEGAWSSAEVWLNGEHVGRHDSGFTSFAFVVSPLLKISEENTLAVRVRQVTRDYTFDVNDDWSLGGIYRDVWLEVMPTDRYIERVETSTRFDSEFRDADLQIRVLVMDDRPTGNTYEVRARLTGPDGDEVERRTLPVTGRARTARDTLMTMHVRAPLHWTAESPNLYRLCVELAVDGVVTHRREHAVGFREVSTAGGVLRVNGQPIKLRGVCRHDQHPDVGNATRHEHWIQDIRMMKEANINAIRMVHYPPNEGFIRLCDQMGMYVIDEVPMGFGGSMAVDPSYAGTTMLRAFETVVRDRNHPSVIIWSVGNENPITALHLAAARYVKGADPTRPVLLPWHPSPEIVADLPRYPGDWMPPEIDILAPHYPSGAEALAMTTRATRPVVATEYAHALAENRFADFAEIWRGLTQKPAGAGGMIWMWQDQGLRQPDGTILLNPNGTDGIVRADRSPQRDYWETKAVYAPVRVPVERVVWKPVFDSVRIPVLNDYDFTNLNAVGIRWELMANERRLNSGEARLSALPHATAWLEIPTATIRSAEPSATCFAHIEFQRPDGSLITRRSVEIVRPEVPRGPLPQGRITVHKGKKAVIRAGSVSYEFDPQTARLENVSAGGRRLITRAALTLWRPLDRWEIGAANRYGIRAQEFPDLDQYSTKVRRWNLTQGPQGARILAEAEHQVGERDAFTAEYCYTVWPDGTLDVAYTVRPHIQAPWIPEIGVELDTDASLSNFRWLGLGPHEALPNLREAAILGLWSGRVGEEAARGIKGEVRWAELSDEKGSGLHLENCANVRILRPGRVRILSAVDGRATKFRRAERPEHRLDIGPSTVLSGGFQLRPQLHGVR